MRAWSSARFTIDLPDGHRFPIAKYARIRDEVVTRGLLPATGIEEPDRADRWALELVHAAAYVQAVIDGTLTPAEVRRLGLPWSPQLRERSLRTVQGTVEAAQDALDGGLGINLAGGTHHAFPDHAEGFCVFNDVAVAIRVLQRAGRITRAAVVDLDVHQGNGTARIFADDVDVFTFSLHGARNFPFRKERSRLDVELEDGCEDAAYLAALDAHLEPVLDAARPELVCLPRRRRSVRARPVRSAGHDHRRPARAGSAGIRRVPPARVPGRGRRWPEVTRAISTTW